MYETNGLGTYIISYQFFKFIHIHYLYNIGEMCMTDMSGFQQSLDRRNIRIWCTVLIQPAEVIQIKTLCYSNEKYFKQKLYLNALN